MIHTIPVFIFCSLFAKGQPHNFSLKGGYSFPFEKEDDLASYSRNDIAIGPNEMLIYEDITPKFMEGVNISLGYEYLFNNHISLWSDLKFVQSVGYKTTSYRGGLWGTDFNGGVQKHEISCQNYALQAGLAFSFGRESQFYRHKISKRFYYQLRAGLSYNEPIIGTTSNSIPESHFEIHAKSTLKGYGVGGNASLRISYRLSRTWEIFINSSIEILNYKATGIKYKLKTVDGIDELDPPSGSPLPATSEISTFYVPEKINFNNYSVAIGLNYNFGKN